MEIRKSVKDIFKEWNVRIGATALWIISLDYHTQNFKSIGRWHETNEVALQQVTTNWMIQSFKSFQNFQMEKQELFKHNKIKWGYERRWSRKWNVKRKHGE